MDESSSIFFSANARTSAIQQGLLVDLSTAAFSQHAAETVAISADIVDILRTRYKSSEQEPTIAKSLQSILQFASTCLRNQDSDFLHTRAEGAEWLPRMGARRTNLDTSEVVITIFIDPVVSPIPAHIRHHQTGTEQLPTPHELVHALRDAWCDESATLGKRDSQLPSIDQRALTWESDDERKQIRSLALRDPVAAALLAERLGYPYEASACWVLAGDINGALNVIPLSDVRTSRGGSHLSQIRTVYSILLDRALNAADLVTLHQNRVTGWGRNHAAEVVQSVQAHIDRSFATPDDIGRQLLHSQDLMWRHAWVPMNHFSTYDKNPGVIFWPDLSSSQMGQELCNNFVKNAENEARPIAGQHKIGEGWVPETELFNLIQKYFGDITTVVHHGRFPALGRQHLDVWIPEWKVAVEYQGLQHDQPVTYFGGEEAFQRQMARDARKKQTCSLHGITLIEVRPDYEIEDLVLEIELYKKG